MDHRNAVDCGCGDREMAGQLAGAWHVGMYLRALHIHRCEGEEVGEGGCGWHRGPLQGATACVFERFPRDVDTRQSGWGMDGRGSQLPVVTAHVPAEDETEGRW